MDQPKKVLIINAYSYKNRGDSGIVVAMIDIIKRTFKNVEISIMSQYYEQNIEYYKKIGVTSVPPVWDIVNTKGFLKKYIIGIKKVLLYKKQSINEIKKADLVLSAGGGYLYSSRRGPLGVGFINALYHLWISKKLNKKVILFPQSIGPLNYSLDRMILKKVFNKMDYFYSRENITTTLLRELKLKLKIEELPDIAFTLEPKKNHSLRQKLNLEENGLNIGITVLDWRFAYKGSDFNDIDLYLSKIASSINNFKNDTDKNINVYIFPQVTVNQKDGDVEVSEILSSKISNNAQVFYLDEIDDPKELIYLYSKMDLFIGSRMHSAIFSLAGNVPTIALAYQPKTKGTFELIKLNDFVLDIRLFNQEELKEKMNQLLILNVKPKNEVKEEVDEIRNQINTAIEHCIKE